AASSGRAGQARTSPGMSRNTARELSLWKWPPKPSWYASPAMRTTRGFLYAPREKKAIDAASPRSWSSALCRYARYWISGMGSSRGGHRTTGGGRDGGTGRGDVPRHPYRPARSERRDHVGGAGQFRLPQDLLGDLAHLPADLVVAAQQLLGRGDSRGGEQLGG